MIPMLRYPDRSSGLALGHQPGGGATDDRKNSSSHEPPQPHPQLFKHGHTSTRSWFPNLGRSSLPSHGSIVISPPGPNQSRCLWMIIMIMFASLPPPLSAPCPATLAQVANGMNDHYPRWLLVHMVVSLTVSLLFLRTNLSSTLSASRSSAQDIEKSLSLDASVKSPRWNIGSSCPGHVFLS